MRSVLIVLFAVLMLTPTGCSKPKEPIRIGVLVWPSYELAYLAHEKSYFDSSRVELIDFLSPAEMVRSYRFGLIDAMFVTSQFALINAERLVDSRIIYVLDFSAGGDALIAQAGIRSIEQLKGKRIGIEAGPTGAYMLERAMQGSAISRNDVELVFLDTPDQKAAFETGAVDAVSTYEPTRSQLLKQGASELFNSREIPLEIIDVIIAKQSAIDSSRQELADFIVSIDRALADFQAMPKEMAAIMVEREHLSVPEFLLAIEGIHLVSLEENRSLMLGDDQRLLEGLRQQCAIMLQAGIMEQHPQIGKIIDTSVIENIER